MYAFSKKLLLHNENLIFHSHRAQILHSVHSTAFEDDRRRECTAITQANVTERLHPGGMSRTPSRARRLGDPVVARVSETEGECVYKIIQAVYDLG